MVQVQIRVRNGVITQVAVPVYPTKDPRSVELSTTAIPTLCQEAVTAQSAAIANVSGATYTSRAFVTSLAAAIQAAGL
jgi:uncharacterized protein with FMN-binding domain